MTAHGKLLYRLPFDVPPGRAGMQPQLALGYSDSGRNGLLGVGFGLEGLSEIRRCHRTRAVDGFPDGVDFDETDRFCLDNVKLVQIDSAVPYGGNGAEYRTEQESYARIRSHGDDGGGPDGFTVWMKDGRIFEYETVVLALRATGSANSAEPAFEDEPVKYTWLLTRIQDRSGNVITYDYDTPLEPTDPVEYSLASIVYTGRDGEPGARSVEMEYEPGERPDPVTACSSGVCERISRRLSTVRFFAPQPHATGPSTKELAWSYHLTYEASLSADTARSRLASIRKCDKDYICQRTKQFQWWELGGPPQFEPTSIGPSIMSHEGQPSHLHVLDVNGDGRDDLLYQLGGVQAAPPVPIYLRLAVDAGAGQVDFGPEIFLNPPGRPIAATDIARSRPVDYDGDGDDELFAAVDPFTNDPSLVDTGVLLETGYLLFRWRDAASEFELATGAQFFFPGSPENDVAQLLDADGDGRLDMFRELTPQSGSTPAPAWFFYQHTDNGFGEAQPTGQASSQGRHARALDLDGDGRGDLLAVDPDSTAGGSSDGPLTGHTFAIGLDDDGELGQDPNWKLGNLTFMELMDINGDGLKDAVYPAAADGSGSIAVRRNNGRGFDPAQPLGNSVWQASLGPSDPGWRVADFDGDGADDVLTLGEYDVNGQQIMRLHLSRTTAFAPAIDLGSESGFMNPQSGWTTTKLGDFDGDGLLDIATFVQTGTWSDDVGSHPMLRLKVMRQDRLDPLYVSDRLLAVSDEANPLPSLQVFYASTDAIKRGTPQSCAYPLRCLTQPFPVVHMVGEAAGGPGAAVRWKLYDYESPVADLQGRGFLGFEVVRQVDPQLRSEVVSHYNFHQEYGAYPEAGAPFQVTRILPILPLPTDPSIELPPLASGALTAQVVDTTYGRHAEWTWPHVHDTRLDNVVTRTWEQEVEIEGERPVLVGDPHDIRQVTDSYLYDGYGNRTETISTVSGVLLRSLSQTSYENRTDPWLIGLPRSRTFEQFDGDDAPPEPRKTVYEYDALGRHMRTTVEPDHPDLSTSTELILNQDGLVEATVTTSVDGVRSTHFAYDEDEGMFVRAVWNDLGHTQQAVHQPAVGLPVVTRDANGRETHFQYDRFGRVRRIDPEGGNSLEIAYSSNDCHFSTAVSGVCVEVLGEDGSRQLTFRDERGRIWESSASAFDGVLVRSLRSYNAFGQQTHLGRPQRSPEIEAPPVGHGTVTQYDTLGRPISALAPGGGTTTFLHTAFSSTKIDPVGRESRVERDEAGRLLLSQTLGDDGEYVSTSYDYGPFGLPESVSPPDLQTVLLGYDKLGRRIWIQDPELGERELEYNAFGELEHASDELHSVWFVRDSLGRVTLRNETHWENLLPVMESAVFVYDQGQGAVGQMSSATVLSPDDTKVVFEYDILGRSTKTSWDVDGDAFSVETSYDGRGRPNLVRYPSIPGDSEGERFAVVLDYNGSGYLEAVADPLVSFPHDAIWKVVERHDDGQLGMAEWRNGVAEVRTQHFGTGWLSDIFTYGNASLFWLGHTYYPDGNVEHRIDGVRGRQEHFEYDALNRLETYELTPPGAEPTQERRYEYDDINRLRRVLYDGVETETFTHAAPNKPRALSSMVDAAGSSHSFEYDARGRQNKRGQQHVEWTWFDLPRLAEGPDGFAAFRYDPFGSRVRKITGQEETISLGGLYERRTTSEAVTHVFYVHGTEGPVAQFVRRITPQAETREWLYLQHDTHGSVGLVFDDNGEEVKDGRVYFEPFGARVDEDGKPSGDMPADVKLGFTGHSHDTDLGLIDMGGRVYDPRQRRFLTPDPIVVDPSFGLSYNRYAYVLNNPIAYTDPSGYSAAPTHPEAASAAPQQFECRPPECFPLAAPSEEARGTRPNAVGSSTGRGFAPSTGTRSEWGPSMSDASKFDASGAASDELAQGIGAKLLTFFANASLAKQGLEQAGVDMIVNTAVGVVTTGIWLADPMVGEAIGGGNPVPGLIDGILGAPELTGWRPADVVLHQVPIIRIGQGVHTSWRLWMEGDPFGSGYAMAAPQAEIAMVALGGFLSAARAGPTFQEGSFSIVDWTGYPANVPKPTGPFRVLVGEEYAAARAAANEANAAIRLRHGLDGSGFQIHEIHPVKFGGSPTDPANKMLLPLGEHIGPNGVHPQFWAPLLRYVTGGGG